MRSNKFLLSAALAALTAVGPMATKASAQLANASASTLGLSGNNTATVRGFGAISVNPAGLAMPGSGFSLAIAPIQLRGGLNPITLSDLAEFDGVLVPTATKEAWLDEITAAGAQAGSIGADVSEFALTFGNIGMQVSTVFSVDQNLPPGAAEAILFGNAGRTGSAANLSFDGATVNGFAFTTAGLSIGIPLGSGASDMALGATVNYTVGHGLVLARGAGGILADPVEVNVNFPTVFSCEVVNEGDGTGCDENFDPFGASGVGLDLGFMMKQDRFSFGASVTNVVNTFEWDTDKLAYAPASAEFRLGESESQTDPEAYSGAPASLKAAVENLTFKPTLQIGAALDVSDDFTVSGDLHNRFSDEGIRLSPKFHLGAGAEFRGLRILHLRAGAAVITDGVQYSGGASLVLGPLNLSAAAAVRTGDLGEVVLGHFALSFGNR